MYSMDMARNTINNIDSNSNAATLLGKTLGRTGFHVTVDPISYGHAFQAIDNNRFDSVDGGGYSGYGIGDTPEEACQDLIDRNKPTLLDYIKDLIESHQLDVYQKAGMYESALWMYFNLCKELNYDNPEGSTLVHCMKLAAEYVKPAETKEVK